jgi:signal transduction histidine kinase
MCSAAIAARVCCCCAVAASASACALSRWSSSAMAREIHQSKVGFPYTFTSVLELYKAGESRDRLRAAFEAAIHRCEPFELDLQIVRSDGEERWVRVIGRVDSVQGRVRWLYGTLQDIDDRVRAEAHRLDRVELASRSKSAFLSRMSHELRTPLSAVLGFSELLARDESVQSSAAAQRQLGHIAEAGKHLLSMIDTVLDLERVEAGAQLRDGFRQLGDGNAGHVHGVCAVRHGEHGERFARRQQVQQNLAITELALDLCWGQVPVFQQLCVLRQRVRQLICEPVEFAADGLPA